MLLAEASTSRERWKASVVLVAIAITAAVTGCSSGADVTADELSAVLTRDGVVFDGEAIPAEFLTRAAGSQVVLLGEAHHLREQLNTALPPDQRIHVRSVDANEEYAGGATDFGVLFEMLTSGLPDLGTVDVSLPPDYAEMSPEDQQEPTTALLATLEANRSLLVESWTTARYDQVVEMVDVEAVSIGIREQRKDDDNGAARSREDLIKQLVDRRVAEDPAGTVINIGGHHAQKSHLMGTEQQWLGDYLAHESPVVDGSVLVVGFTSARTELEAGADGTPFDILDSASPDNEILRLIAEIWPGQTVFLPFGDPLFADHRVAYDVIYATSLRDQFDGLIQYGSAHRMPID